MTVLTPYPDAPPKPDKPVELDETGRKLMEAAEIVRQGWCQDGLLHIGHRFCALGAIGMTYGNVCIGTSTPAYRRLVHSLGFPREYDGLGRWNDEPGRTAEEVAQAMERAAYEV